MTLTFREELKALINRRWMEDPKLSRPIIELIIASEPASPTTPPVQPRSPDVGTEEGT